MYIISNVIQDITQLQNIVWQQKDTSVHLYGTLLNLRSGETYDFYAMSFC